MFKQEHAEMAITELNGKVIDDRTLKVSIANSRF
jgi:RNA recognition motif-containing protein